MSIHPTVQVPTEPSVAMEDCDLPAYPESKMRFTVMFNHLKTSMDWVELEWSLDGEYDFDAFLEIIGIMGLRLGDAVDLNQGSISSVVSDHNLVWAYSSLYRRMQTYVHKSHSDSALLLKLKFK